MEDNKPNSIRRQSIYLLPNAFTTAALFAGFFAIIQSINGNFDFASIAIFVAMVLDGMDGRVARLTNTQSSFGEHYDSLSDMTSFGVAPAIVMYQFSLLHLGRWGWMAAFVYMACAALRLARFNTNIGVVDKNFFQGLPSPAAAALVAGFIWLIVDNKIHLNSDWDAAVCAAVTIYAGVSMVTNAPFFSGKSMAMAKSIPLWGMFLLVLLFVFILGDPPIVLFSLFVLYSLSGYALWLIRRVRKVIKRARDSKQS